ncbi:C-type lectin domain family 6 member A-like isoform X1 [Erpetoichthys calabaricus]|uniref:C-type lectin domain family 6 member A-like isoform X1 n=1 Tax=Erpetoichthys calabaricus TaxID=27687 RepID=UPI0022343ABE|nr:C-type lectin domain family 6 member A-like isoform X1 [Erpetoichthys calabaricus]
MADEVQYASLNFLKKNQQARPCKDAAETEDVTYTKIKKAKLLESTQKVEHTADPAEERTYDAINNVESLQTDKIEPPARVVYKAFLFKLLLLLCALLMAIIIFMVVYHLHFLNHCCTDLKAQYSDFNKSYTELHSSCTEINKTNAKLSSRFAALTKQCSSNNALPQEENCLLCSNGWHLFKSKCYFFSTDKRNWIFSRNECISKGGHLVIIESEEEQRFLDLNIKKEEKYMYWIGLSYQKKENEFRWENNMRVTTIKFWGTDQPNKQSGNSISEECVLLMTDKDGIKWHDFPCENSEQMICESAAVQLHF